MHNFIEYGLTNKFRPSNSTIKCLYVRIYINDNGNPCMGMLYIQSGPKKCVHILA